MIKKRVILKKGKDKAVKNRHHWIFSGAIKEMPQFNDGEILDVYSANSEFLGRGYFNRRSSITGRMLSFDDVNIDHVLRKKIGSAIELRRSLFGDNTNAYRLINAEGDGLPGLIVDKYDKVIVIQIGTLGMEKLKQQVCDILNDMIRPDSIYEKSALFSRKEEGLKAFEGLLSGEVIERVHIKEDGIELIVDITNSQKTGFFMDQREMRKLVQRFSRHKRVFNLFSYTGGFSVYALRGGASKVDSVDSSESAMMLLRDNLRLNGFSLQSNGFFVADVFNYLRISHDEYDFIILDPPAFAKKRKDVTKACRGYKDINRLAIKKIQAGGLVLTSSCSHHIDDKLFGQVIYQAANEAGRNVRILQKHHLAPDHPINIYHPESAYLKSLLLYVE